MADVEEGNNPKPIDNIARQKLKDLRNRLWVSEEWGPGEKLADPPQVIHCEVMGVLEVWRRGAVLGGAGRESTVYELDRSER